MRVREATLEDRDNWDRFVDAQNGAFMHYFDWKYVEESRNMLPVQLLAENDAGEIISLFPVTKTRHSLYPALSAGAPLFMRDLPPPEKQRLTAAYLEYLDGRYTSGCSFFMIEAEAQSALPQALDAAFLAQGFRSRYDAANGLPCLQLLDLEQPFDEKIWMNLWSKKFRQALRKVEKNGVSIVVDTRLQYLDEYISMLRANHKRLGEKPPSALELEVEFKFFRDKSKLFVAMLGDRPQVILSCHYTPSTCYLWRVGSYTKGTSDANKLTYKAAVEDACNLGYKHADFGYTRRDTLAELKDRFRVRRIPVIPYEKRYSVPGTLLRVIPLFVKTIYFNTRRDRSYLWKKRRAILDRIIHW